MIDYPHKLTDEVYEYIKGEATHVLVQDHIRLRPILGQEIAMKEHIKLIPYSTLSGKNQKQSKYLAKTEHLKKTVMKIVFTIITVTALNGKIGQFFTSQGISFQTIQVELILKKEKQIFLLNLLLHLLYLFIKLRLKILMIYMKILKLAARLHNIHLIIIKNGYDIISKAVS